jgi:hypothetical protein
VTDAVERAKAALEGVTDGPWKIDRHEENDYDSVTVGAGTYLQSPGIYTSTDLIHKVDTYGIELDSPDYERIVADAGFIAAARALVPELVAEIEWLHSWDGLMSLLDEHYPESVFPTADDREGRDSGPRIVSLIRQLNRLRADSGNSSGDLRAAEVAHETVMRWMNGSSDVRRHVGTEVVDALTAAGYVVVQQQVDHDELCCDCCERRAVRLYTDDEGESWICGECSDAAIADVVSVDPKETNHE